MASENHGQGSNYLLNFRINGKQLVTSNIVNLCIREWILDIVPRMEFLLNDDGVLSEIYPLSDGDSIDIVLAKNGRDENPINISFILQAYTCGSMMGDKYLQFKGNGSLKLNNFYVPLYNRSFKNKNSVDILKIIAAEAGVSLSKSANLYTNDLMTWYQIWQNNNDFIKHILKRSNKANDVIFCYAGTDSILHLTSLNEMLSQRLVREARYSIDNYGEESFENNADLQTLWFNTWNITSMASIFNKIGNYSTNYNYFTSEGFIEDDISDNTHVLTDSGSKDPSNTGQTSRNLSFGYLNDRNVFQDYFKAITTNEYLKKNFLGGYFVEININALCPVRLGEIVQLYLPSTLISGYNNVFSGKYLVVGIIHEATKTDIYKKRVFLFRNGINKSSLV